MSICACPGVPGSARGLLRRPPPCHGTALPDNGLLLRTWPNTPPATPRSPGEAPGPAQVTHAGIVGYRGGMGCFAAMQIRAAA
jgi:hypothetical protein